MPDSDVAVLALTRVKIRERRWTPARVYVFADRIEVLTDSGARVLPLASVTWVGVKPTLRTAVLAMLTADGQRLAVSGLRRPDASRAHRTIVELAARVRTHDRPERRS